MFYFYIIYSKKLDKYYIGHTADLTVRLIQHNKGISGFTSKSDDWIVVYAQQFNDRLTARNREMDVKRKKSRKYIEWLIKTQI